MKIGIFGDSYANKCSPRTTESIKKYHWFEGELKDRIFENISKDRYFWHDYLQEKGHEVIDYALGGTDIYYSYYQWYHNHHNCDRCIFVVTNFKRYSIKDCNGNWYKTVSYDDAKEKKRTASTYEDKVLFGAFCSWYKEIYDRDPHRQLMITNLMLEDVKRQRPNTLFIPGITFNEEPCLINITNMEMKKPNIFLEKRFDMRDGHLTRQNQYLLGKQVHKAFENGVQELVINFDDYDFNFSDETIKKYWPNKKEAKQLILELYG